MKLQSIEISNYKSVKEPVKISLTADKPTVFTGKNGSGKTNLLEAIHIALSDKIYHYDGARDICVKRTYKLDKAEMEEYFSLTEEKNDGKLDEIEVVFDREEPDIKWATVPALKLSVEKFRPRLEKVKAEFDASSKKYLEIIDGFLNEIGYDGFLYFAVNGNENFYDGKSFFKNNLFFARESFKATEEEVNKLLDYLKSGVVKFDSTSDGRYFPERGFGYGLELGQITAYKFVADKMSAHCLGITQEKIDEANLKFEKIVADLNGRLKEEHAKISAQLKEFEKIAKEVKNLTWKFDDDYWDKHRQMEERQSSFYAELVNAMRRKCYFLDNENSMLFFDDRNGMYGRSGKRERNLNSYNPIMDAFDNFLKVGGHYKENESIKEFSKLPQDRKTRLVKILNDKFFKYKRLDFDKNIKYKLEMDGGAPELFVIEKNGEMTNFNNTSLGRRWHLTYVFVKRLLKEGDCLLIDEPAAFLHPQAQAEFRREIEGLAKKGITVFYTTHSPNMVSFGVDIYGVEMGEKQTEVTKLDFYDADAKGTLEGIWGPFDFYKDLVFNLSDTTVLVEGVADKTCIEKFAWLLGYDLSGYNVHVCDGEAILQCFYLLHKSGKKVFMIADADNKFKGASYKKQHPNYEKIIEYIEANPEPCYFLGSGKHGCIEDLFADPDRELPIYNKIEGKKKIAPKKIEKIKDLAAYGKAAENFENIFAYFDVPKIKR